MLFQMSRAFNNTHAIIFDFDLTLVDSSSASVECISFALKEMGLPVPTPELICKTIGMSLEDALEALTLLDDPGSGKEFRRLFVQRADEVMLDMMTFLDGVKQVLLDLDRRDILLGVVSNKYRYRIEAFLLREHLENLVDVIVGYEDTPKPKPDPDGLIIAMNKLGKPKNEMVYIGDSWIDAETAGRIGVSFIAVLTGITSRQDFKPYSPCYIIDTLRELPQLLS
jgi:phosphoglycolate phosphatase